MFESEEGGFRNTDNYRKRILHCRVTNFSPVCSSGRWHFAEQLAADKCIHRSGMEFRLVT